MTAQEAMMPMWLILLAVGGVFVLLVIAVFVVAVIANMRRK